MRGGQGRKPLPAAPPLRATGRPRTSAATQPHGCRDCAEPRRESSGRAYDARERARCDLPSVRRDGRRALHRCAAWETPELSRRPPLRRRSTRSTPDQSTRSPGAAPAPAKGGCVGGVTHLRVGVLGPSYRVAPCRDQSVGHLDNAQLLGGGFARGAAAGGGRASNKIGLTRSPRNAGAGLAGGQPPAPPKPSSYTPAWDGGGALCAGGAWRVPPPVLALKLIGWAVVRARA